MRMGIHATQMQSEPDSWKKMDMVPHGTINEQNLLAFGNQCFLFFIATKVEERTSKRRENQRQASRSEQLSSSRWAGEWEDRRAGRRLEGQESRRAREWKAGQWKGKRVGGADE